ncbi:hypothetical protein SLS56_010463 [Neofusicoccum ribis]|uniref:Uncharacterized protein n=1 Tax=Neofusicoccum ribis TaxID=45134 RepID=A0ABR3SEG7_9PEZI
MEGDPVDDRPTEETPTEITKDTPAGGRLDDRPMIDVDAAGLTDETLEEGRPTEDTEGVPNGVRLVEDSPMMGVLELGAEGSPTDDGPEDWRPAEDVLAPGIEEAEMSLSTLDGATEAELSTLDGATKAELSTLDSKVEAELSELARLTEEPTLAVLAADGMVGELLLVGLDNDATVGKPVEVCAEGAPLERGSESAEAEDCNETEVSGRLEDPEITELEGMTERLDGLETTELKEMEGAELEGTAFVVVCKRDEAALPDDGARTELRTKVVGCKVNDLVDVPNRELPLVTTDDSTALLDGTPISDKAELTKAGVLTEDTPDGAPTTDVGVGTLAEGTLTLAEALTDDRLDTVARLADELPDGTLRAEGTLADGALILEARLVGIPDERLEEIPDGKLEDTAERMLDGMTDTRLDITPDGALIPDTTLEGMPDGTLDGITDEVLSPDSKLEEAEGSTLEGIPDGRLEGAPESRLEEAPDNEDAPGSEEAPDSRLEGPPDNKLEGTPDGRFERTTEAVLSPDSRVEGAPDSTFEEVPDGRTEETPDNRLEGAPDNELEETPDSKLEGTPESKLEEMPDGALTPDDKLEGAPDSRLDEAPDETLAPEDRLKDGVTRFVGAEGTRDEMPALESTLTNDELTTDGKLLEGLPNEALVPVGILADGSTDETLDPEGRFGDGALLPIDRLGDRELTPALVTEDKMRDEAETADGTLAVGTAVDSNEDGADGAVVRDPSDTTEDADGTDADGTDADGTDADVADAGGLKEALFDRLTLLCSTDKLLAERLRRAEVSGSKGMEVPRTLKLFDGMLMRIEVSGSNGTEVPNTLKLFDGRLRRAEVSGSNGTDVPSTLKLLAGVLRRTEVSGETVTEEPPDVTRAAAGDEETRAESREEAAMVERLGVADPEDPKVLTNDDRVLRSVVVDAATLDDPGELRIGDDDGSRIGVRLDCADETVLLERGLLRIGVKLDTEGTTLLSRAVGVEDSGKLLQRALATLEGRPLTSEPELLARELLDTALLGIPLLVRAPLERLPSAESAEGTTLLGRVVSAEDRSTELDGNCETVLATFDERPLTSEPRLLERALLD